MLKIFKTSCGYVAVKDNRATNFYLSLKRGATFGVDKNYSIGELLSGKNLNKKILYTIIEKLK